MNSLRFETETRPTSHDVVEQVVSALCRVGNVRTLRHLGAAGPPHASAGCDSAFACLFGRDSLRMSLDLLDDFPRVAHTTICTLTALQGLTLNDRTEEEPGRILHEHRTESDPLAAQMRWTFPYYGAVDTTPLYVILIGKYCCRYGTSILAETVRARDGRQVTIGTGLERALVWIEQRLQPHGYITVQRAHPDGIQHQFWEDSYDSQFHADGRLLDAQVPYAPVAVQAYAYDALMLAAGLQQDAGRRAHWMTIASQLRRRVLAKFWMSDLETFSPGMVMNDSAPELLRVVASSAGHLLLGRVLDGEDAAPYRNALIRRLLAADMLASAGVRTKSTTSARFAPGSYHNGSVWPMDTGIIAQGLQRHGFHQEADDLEERLLTACAQIGSPVEFFRGDTDDTIRINTAVVDEDEDGVVRRREQPPQTVQGWTATRLWCILRRRGLVADPRELEGRHEHAENGVQPLPHYAATGIDKGRGAGRGMPAAA